MEIVEATENKNDWCVTSSHTAKLLFTCASWSAAVGHAQGFITQLMILLPNFLWGFASVSSLQQHYDTFKYYSWLIIYNGDDEPH